MSKPNLGKKEAKYLDNRLVFLLLPKLETVSPTCAPIITTHANLIDQQAVNTSKFDISGVDFMPLGHLCS